MQVFYNTFLFSFAEPLSSIDPEGAAKLKEYLMPDSSYKVHILGRWSACTFSFSVENISM
jgi:hypothetical protein